MLLAKEHASPNRWQSPHLARVALLAQPGCSSLPRFGCEPLPLHAFLHQALMLYHCISHTCASLLSFCFAPLSKHGPSHCTLQSCLCTNTPRPSSLRSRLPDRGSGSYRQSVTPADCDQENTISANSCMLQPRASLAFHLVWRFQRVRLHQSRMMIGNRSCQDDSEPNSGLCNRDLDGSALCYSRPQSCPKLGDFTSLRSATAGFHPPHHILNRQLPSKGDTRLGDLSKVVNQLRALKSAPKKPRDEDLVTFNNASCKSIQIASISDSEADLFSSADNARTAPTRAAREQISSSNQVSLQRSRSTLDHRTSRVSLHRRKKSTSQLTRILTYELSDKAVVVPIFDVARTVEAAHRSLTQNLIPYCTADRHLTLKFPSNSSHGVYIFLDLSNIEISFQKALKKRYGVADAARFSPLPRLNLQFLTELLVRGRSSRGLHVGCSIFPGRKEPRYVQALRNLGYQVDVRERKRVDNGGLNVSQSKLPSALGTKPGSRYVEDLVDETLQTRIAEAVMEHFQKQGTIVLATGDAKPAQYSDGFFRYVERALRMGWNVELVAWHGSLSSSWKDNDWTATWGEKFRVIELDSFAYDLLEVQS